MAVYETVELVDKENILHVFVQHSSTTEYHAFKHTLPAGMHAQAILDMPADVRHNLKNLLDLADSVTMPKFTRFTKKATFTVLPGLSGKNPTRDVKIRGVKAIRR